jgi:hypothetical protein
MDTKKNKPKRGGRRPGSGRKVGIPNKSTKALKEIAGKYTEAAVKTLVAVMEDKEAPPAARVAAADKLLDRGHGRPAQMIEATLEQKSIDTKELQVRYITLIEKSCLRQIEVANERRGHLGDEQADQMIEEANKRLSKLRREDL